MVAVQYFHSSPQGTPWAPLSSGGILRGPKAYIPEAPINLTVACLRRPITRHSSITDGASVRRLIVETFAGWTLASLNGSALHRFILLRGSIVLQPGSSFWSFSAFLTLFKHVLPPRAAANDGWRLFRDFHERITCFFALNAKLWQLLFNKPGWFLTYLWGPRNQKPSRPCFLPPVLSACLVSSSPALVIIISSTSRCPNVTGIIQQRGVWFKLLYSVFLGSIPEFDATDGIGLFKNNQWRKIKLRKMLKEYKLTHYQLGSLLPPRSSGSISQMSPLTRSLSLLQPAG